MSYLNEWMLMSYLNECKRWSVHWWDVCWWWGWGWTRREGIHPPIAAKRTASEALAASNVSLGNGVPAASLHITNAKVIHIDDILAAYPSDLQIYRRDCYIHLTHTRSLITFFRVALESKMRSMWLSQRRSIVQPIIGDGLTMFLGNSNAWGSSRPALSSLLDCSFKWRRVQ